MRKSESNIRQSINLCSTLIGLIVWTTLLLVLTAWTAAAAPGDLDTTFANNGRLVDWTGRATDVAIQADGKIVVVGRAGVARYNDDGSPDATFGIDGKVPAPAPSLAYFTSVAVQDDKKIVVTGFWYVNGHPPQFMLIRYTQNGSLDTTFDRDGIVITPRFDSDDYAEDLVIQPDGKIIAVGCTSSLYDFPCNNWALARYNSDGSLDATFGFGGQVITRFPPTWTFAELYSAALQPDGKIVAAGYLRPTGLTSDFAVVRYNPNGSLDTTFDSDGIVTTPIGTGWEEARSIAIQADGKIVAAGEAEITTPISSTYFAVVRYNTNGSLDTTFDGDGKATTLVGNSGGAYSIAVQRDGRLVTAGTADNGFGDSMAIVRYMPDGHIDTTFGGGDGQTMIGFPGNSNAQVYGMALDNSGRAVVTGTSDDHFAIARLLLNSNASFDYDGDGRSDISVFRPSDGTWYLNQSTNGFSATQFGLSTDKLTPADFDGDGRTDISVFRDGVWYWLNSLNGNFNAVQFGIFSDIPVPADYTGDGRAELAVYRGGVWYTHNLTNNQFQAVQFGISTDKPVVGDYDGDGRADHAVYREGTWYLLRSTQGFAAIQFGLSTDKLVPADYDGDGKTDQAVYRDGAWYVFGSQTGFTPFQFGLASDIPAPADYDGDGRTDAAVYRDGVWYLLQSTAGASTVQFGLANDRPIPSAYMP